MFFLQRLFIVVCLSTLVLEVYGAAKKSPECLDVFLNKTLVAKLEEALPEKYSKSSCGKRLQRHLRLEAENKFALSNNIGMWSSDQDGCKIVSQAYDISNFDLFIHHFAQYASLLVAKNIKQMNVDDKEVFAYSMVVSEILVSELAQLKSFKEFEKYISAVSLENRINKVYQEVNAAFAQEKVKQQEAQLQSMFKPVKKKNH